MSLDSFLYEGYEKSVISSNVESIQYNIDAEILTVSFLNGWIYQYLNVDIYTAQDFYEAPSYGKFVHQRLIGNYAYRRIA